MVKLIHDFVEDNGKTIKENNMEKIHNIELLSLVETDKGIRLFVLNQGRDCDGTPLYWLGVPDPNYFHGYLTSAMYPHMYTIGGFSEESLTVIEGPNRGADIIEEWLDEGYYTIVNNDYGGKKIVYRGHKEDRC